ncbi:MAG: hypothetical protein COY40_05735 [Alphaproteobacteria bacterium CG_4_10_14_0_8_um_filter_53_9]|nr:MAG: hypothetical protein COY40_05735 [Alphaproteobacteria bacterium CG_4_10_14_0_8_um_filter_53_9]
MTDPTVSDQAQHDLLMETLDEVIQFSEEGRPIRSSTLDYMSIALMLIAQDWKKTAKAPGTKNFSLKKDAMNLMAIFETGLMSAVMGKKWGGEYSVQSFAEMLKILLERHKGLVPA